MTAAVLEIAAGVLLVFVACGLLGVVSYARRRRRDVMPPAVLLERRRRDEERRDD